MGVNKVADSVGAKQQRIHAFLAAARDVSFSFYLTMKMSLGSERQQAIPDAIDGNPSGILQAKAIPRVIRNRLTEAARYFLGHWNKASILSGQNACSFGEDPTRLLMKLLPVYSNDLYLVITFDATVGTTFCSVQHL